MSFEIPIFHYSDRLLKVLNNHQLMTIACLAYISRVIWYTSFQNPWLVLVVEPLHGVTFACKALGMLSISWSSFVRSPPVSVSRFPWHHDGMHAHASAATWPARLWVERQMSVRADARCTCPFAPEACLGLRF